jgi:hypothetical protein
MAEDLNKAVGDSAALVGAKLGAVAGVGAAAGAAAPGGAPPGGRFSFEPDQIRAVITEWDKLIEAYDADDRAADRLINVRAPGDEYASRSMAQSANDSGQKVKDSIVAQRDYCMRQRDKFQAALNQYLGVDDAAAKDISRHRPASGGNQQSSGAL